MCHILTLIALTLAFVPCYGKITAKCVCRSIRKAIVEKVENRIIVSSSLTIEQFEINEYNQKYALWVLLVVFM